MSVDEKQPNFGQIPASDLCKQCRNPETDGAHEPYCMELFRRAVGEQCQECWHCIYEQYQFLVLDWIQQRVRGEQVGLAQSGDLVTIAFAKFWRYFGRDSFGRARGLSDVLAYLRSCARTAVLEELRRAQRGVIVNDLELGRGDGVTGRGDQIARSLAGQELAQSIWLKIEAKCKTAKEREVAWLTFTTHLKPSEIVGEGNHAYRDVREVYDIKRKLMARLGRDESIRNLCGDYLQLLEAE